MINLYHWFEWKNNEAREAAIRASVRQSLLGDYYPTKSNKPHYKYNWKLNKAELVRW